MFKRNAFLFGTMLGTACAIAVQVAPVFAQAPSAAAQAPSAAAQAPSAAAQGSQGDGIFVENCMVRFVNKTKVPSETQGKLTELLVEEGMSIKKGDIIATVEAKQAQLAFEAKKAEETVAKLNAQNDINSRDAIATEKIARAEANTYEKLHERGATPYWEMRKKQAEADRALLRIELAELNEESAMAEYIAKQFGTRLAETDVEMRTIRADFDAYVENRFAQLGEWVQPGSPIVELVQMDRVRVEGFIDALNYAGQVRIGAPVQVTVIIGGTVGNPVTKVYSGNIEYVSTELDLAKRHRIWVSVPNERRGDSWLIKPGMAATMRISTSPQATGSL